MKQKEKIIPLTGSYQADDVQFLLQDITDSIKEVPTFEKERLIQSGVHYSEMLPVEHLPTKEYVELFFKTLDEYSYRVAVAVGVVAEKIIEHRGLERLVLVSLARAGTPIGILIKRYIKHKYDVSVPHYSISIIRGRGIDVAAIDYIFFEHSEATIQFIDGWTGKGAITRELIKACDEYNQSHPNQLCANLAVLADPGHCANIYGTRDDFFIPSACLNATVSGLLSRTVLNEHLTGRGSFHGVKYYKEFAENDLSNDYVDKIIAEFTNDEIKLENEIQRILESHTLNEENLTTWEGMNSVKRIQETFGITNVHYIKPGVGETTRVLLRRVPWKILINPNNLHDLEHILLLAKERGVPVEYYGDMSYSCCGIIKDTTQTSEE